MRKNSGAGFPYFFPYFLEKWMQYRTVLKAALQAAGLYLAGIVVPVLGQIAVLFVPVPLVYAYVTAGRREGLAATALAAGTVAVLGWWQAALPIFFLSFGLMAVGIAEGMRLNLKPERTILLGGLLPVAGLSLFLALFFLKAGTNPLTAAEKYLRESVAEAAKLYSGLGLTDLAAALSDLGDTFVYYFVRLLPGIIITASAAQALCCYGLTKVLVLRRQGSARLFASQPPLALWHAPDQWVWGLIISLGLVVLPHPAARLTGLNAAIFYLLLYTVQGTAVLEFYLRKFRIPAAGRSFLITVILALPLVVAVVAAGVVDIWADFRKVRTEKNTKVGS